MLCIFRCQKINTVSSISLSCKSKESLKKCYQSWWPSLQDMTIQERFLSGQRSAWVRTRKKQGKLSNSSDWQSKNNFLMDQPQPIVWADPDLIKLGWAGPVFTDFCNYPGLELRKYKRAGSPDRVFSFYTGRVKIAFIREQSIILVVQNVSTK